MNVPNQLQHETWLALGLAAAVYLGLWVLVGRDPRSQGPRPRNTPPPGISAAGARFLLLGRYDLRALTACVLALAVKGFLSVQQGGEYLGLLRRERDYPGEPVDQQIANLQDELAGGDIFFPEETAAAQGLFARHGEVLLGPRQRQVVRLAGDRLRRALRTRYLGAYVRDNWPYHVGGFVVSLLLLLAVCLRAGLRGAGVALALIIALVMVAQMITPLWAGITRPLFRLLFGHGTGVVVRGIVLVVLLALGIGLALGAAQLARFIPRPLLTLVVGMAAINGLFQYLLRAHTPRGRLALDTLAGFRRFLTGEAHNVPWPDGLPGPTPALFSRYLPYAVALDVAPEWLHRCAPALAQPDVAFWHATAWLQGTPGQLPDTIDPLIVADTELQQALHEALTAPIPDADPYATRGDNEFPPVM